MNGRASPVSPSESVFDALQTLQGETLGDPEVCLAVLDGPADLGHPCFRGADLRRVRTMVPGTPGTGAMSLHGTHVASVIFGQPQSPVVGVAPRCRGIIVPVFRDDPEGYLPQLDLARAIEQAVQEGTRIINVSGGELAPTGEPESSLARALRLCEESDVLVVAAAGNDGCDCLHVPAAVPPALAVGAMSAVGTPLESSNWGDAYRSNGVLAPGEGIRGAIPGGGIAARTGSSFATPLVAGVAALLMSIQRREGQEIDGRAVRRAILDSAFPCYPRENPECAPYLAGSLNIAGAYATIKRGGNRTVSDVNPRPLSSQGDDAAPVAHQPGREAGLAPPAAPTGPAGSATHPNDVSPQVAGTPSGRPDGAAVAAAAAPEEESTGPSLPETTTGATEQPPTPPANGHSDEAPPQVPGVIGGVQPATDCDCHSDPVSNIFAIGEIGFDFGTEARRDTFRQLMLPIPVGSPPTFRDPNPYDPNQLGDYLNENPWESTKLIWTLCLDLTPIYAIEAEAAYAEEVYSVLREAVKNQVRDPADEYFVSRVSIAGVLTTRTVRLYSGQMLPVVVASRRGMYIWKEAHLVDAVVTAVQSVREGADDLEVRRQVRNYLDKVYYDLRNLGQSPADRAVNFAATNAFMATTGIADLVTSGERVAGSPNLYTLDTITVAKSSYCRPGSECYDVRITFFDPEQDRRARAVHQFTVDVSDPLPVQLSETHTFSTALR